jgi:hypothetical protein
MAIIPGFDYDLFVSYAHADDMAADGQDGWVAQFVRHLEPTLRQRLGGAEALKIFFDSRATGANNNLPELLQAARRSALFLVVGSPSYANRDWPQKELEAFIHCTPEPSRLFMVECLPLAIGESYPAPLDVHIRLEFWKLSGRKQVPVPIWANSDPQEFSTLVHGLASDIRERLLWMRHIAGGQERIGAGSKAGSAARPNESGDLPVRPVPVAKTILVAQPTDDVADEADELVRYLNQYSEEINVLPKSGYPQGGDAFMAAFRQDLVRTDLFVQLLGRRPGRVPPDLPEGYTRFQIDAAKEASVEIMQWRHPNLDATQTSDPLYRKLLTAETVVASGLEAFKNQILAAARRRKPEPRKSDAKSQLPTVFINADDKDLPVAREIERECLQQALTTVLPMKGPSSEAKRRDLAESLTDCDVLLFIYGDTTQDWIRSQLRFFGKVKQKRDSEPKLLAICSGPPVPKPDIGIKIPNAHVITFSEAWDMAAIRKLLEELPQ